MRRGWLWGPTCRSAACLPSVRSAAPPRSWRPSSERVRSSAERRTSAGALHMASSGERELLLGGRRHSNPPPTQTNASTIASTPDGSAVSIAHTVGSRVLSRVFSSTVWRISPDDRARVSPQTRALSSCACFLHLLPRLRRTTCRHADSDDRRDDHLCIRIRQANKI